MGKDIDKIVSEMPLDEAIEMKRALDKRLAENLWEKYPQYILQPIRLVEREISPYEITCNTDHTMRTVT